MKQRIILKFTKLSLKEWMHCKLNDYEVSCEQNEMMRILAPYLNYAPSDYIFKNLTGEEYLPLILPERSFFHLDTRKTLYVSEKNQKEFEKTLYLIFRNRLWDYIEDKMRYSRQFKKIILQFCTDHNVTFQHINYEALKKDFYRKRKNKKKHWRKMSLKCPQFFLT